MLQLCLSFDMKFVLNTDNYYDDENDDDGMIRLIIKILFT